MVTDAVAPNRHHFISNHHAGSPEGKLLPWRMVLRNTHVVNMSSVALCVEMVRHKTKKIIRSFDFLQLHWMMKMFLWLKIFGDTVGTITLWGDPTRAARQTGNIIIIIMKLVRWFHSLTSSYFHDKQQQLTLLMLRLWKIGQNHVCWCLGSMHRHDMISICFEHVRSLPFLRKDLNYMHYLETWYTFFINILHFLS